SDQRSRSRNERSGGPPGGTVPAQAGGRQAPENAEASMDDAANKGYEFDFDDWADLYKRDPAAFEARRQAVLALEIAKAGPVAAPARHSLRKLDKFLEGKSDEERVRQSMVWMVASMRQLSEKLTRLGDAVDEMQERASRAAGLGIPRR